jgi:hypothetical protein
MRFPALSLFAAIPLTVLAGAAAAEASDSNVAEGILANGVETNDASGLLQSIQANSTDACEAAVRPIFSLVFMHSSPLPNLLLPPSQNNLKKKVTRLYKKSASARQFTHMSSALHSWRTLAASKSRAATNPNTKPQLIISGLHSSKSPSHAAYSGRRRRKKWPT